MNNSESYPEWEWRPTSWYRMLISIGVIWPNLFAAWTNSSIMQRREEERMKQHKHERLTTSDIFYSRQIVFANTVTCLFYWGCIRRLQKKYLKLLNKLCMRCTSLLWSTLNEHAISAAPCVTPLCVLYIQFFTVACWEAPLPSGGLSQRKPNGSCWRREKSSLFTSHTKTFLSGPSIATFAYKPASLILSSAMTYFSLTDGWHFSVCFTLVSVWCLLTHNKNYLQILFAQSLF